MRKHLSILLAFFLLCSLLASACSRNSERPQNDRDNAEWTESADERDDEGKQSSPEEESDDITPKIIDICERNGVDLTFSRLDYTNNADPQAGMHGYYRTICDTFDGERDPTFQITIDEYADADAGREDFRQLKESLLEHANSLDIVKVLLDDENTFATHLDAYGSISNLMYVKGYKNYIISIVASTEDGYESAYTIMQEIEALIAEL